MEDAAYDLGMVPQEPDQAPSWNGTTIGRLFYLAGQRAFRGYAESLRPLDLRPTDFRVLSYLSQHSSSAQAELATALHADPGNLVSTVARLQERGWLERRRKALDQRRYQLTLTASGVERLRAAEAAIASAERRLVVDLTPEEVDQLQKMLLRLTGGGS